MKSLVEAQIRVKVLPEVQGAGVRSGDDQQNGAPGIDRTRAVLVMSGLMELRQVSERADPLTCPSAAPLSR